MVLVKRATLYVGAAVAERSNENLDGTVALYQPAGILIMEHCRSLPRFTKRSICKQ